MRCFSRQLFPFVLLLVSTLLLLVTAGGTQKFSMHRGSFTADWKELPRYGRVKACPVLLALHSYHFEKPLGLQEECENVAAFPANIWFPLP